MGHQLAGVSKGWGKAIVDSYLLRQDGDQKRDTIMIPKRAVELPKVVVIDGLELLKVDNRDVPMEIGGVYLKLVTDLLPNVGASIPDIRCINCHQAPIV